MNRFCLLFFAIGLSAAEFAPIPVKGLDTTGKVPATGAIQAALNAAQGKTVMLPCGILLLDGRIDVPNNTRIQGCGVPMYNRTGGTILRLKPGATVTNMLRTGDIDHAQTFESWFAEDFTLDGNANNGSVITEAVIGYQKVFSPAYLRNLYITNYSAGVPGVWVGPGWRTEGAGPLILQNLWITPHTDAPGIKVSSYYSVNTTDATNANPIVIALSQPHGMADGEPVTVAGIRGNTAANGSWFAKATGFDSRHFALYADPRLSRAVAGNGAYEGGGTAGVEGYAEEVAIEQAQVEFTGSQPAIITDAWTFGKTRSIHVRDLRCWSSGSGACAELRNTYASNWENVTIHPSPTQVTGIHLDARSLGNNFRGVLAPGGYRRMNVIVDDQTGLTTPKTVQRIASYSQSNNDEDHTYMGRDQPLPGAAAPPATSDSPCRPGTVAFDTNHIYVCTAPNTWKRAPLSGW